MAGEEERDALHQVIGSLEEFDTEAQTRILETVALFLGIEVKLSGEAR